MEPEIRESIVRGLQFTSGFLPNFTDTILLTNSVHPDVLATDLHKTMRRTLPVPVIYTSLMILYRMVEFANLQKEALENEVSVKLPKTKNHVDYTVKKIFKEWNKQISVFTSSNSDFKENGWNPWVDVSNALEVAVKRNLEMFFGISK